MHTCSISCIGGWRVFFNQYSRASHSYDASGVALYLESELTMHERYNSSSDRSFDSNGQSCPNSTFVNVVSYKTVKKLEMTCKCLADIPLLAFARTILTRTPRRAGRIEYSSKYCFYEDFFETVSSQFV